MKESKILLVDDDESVLSGMGAMLKRERYKVKTAKSGEKAINLLEKNTFDLIITDLVMGKVDGFAVVKKAKELYPETTTMILTGYKTTDFAINALRIGVDDYLIKPSEADDILFRVRRCLEKCKANKERRQVEEELRESEEHLRLVLQSIPSFVAESDLNGNVLSLNKVQAGFSLEDFVGKSILDTTHPKSREIRKKSFHDIIEKGISVEYEAEDYGPNKSQAYYHFNLSPVFKDGEIKSIILVVSDITERKRAEQEQHLLLSAIEQSSEGIATADLNGNLLFVNKAMAAMHGYTPEELTGRNLSIFHTPEQMAAVARANKQIQETGEFTGEIGHVRKDGNLLPGIMQNSIIRDEEGNSIGITGTLRDITEQKRNENLIQSLSYLGISLSAESRLDEGLRLSLEAAISISVMDCGGIYLVDAVSGALDLAFQKGLTPDFIDSVSHYDSKSASARLVMAGKPIYSSHQGTGIPLTEEKKLEGLKALAIIPILHESHVIGCMNIASHTHEEVPAFSRKALELITTQIGSALARLKTEEALLGSEARLAESNQLLAGVLEHTHMMAVFLDPQFNFIWVNRAYADTCRHEPSFFPGKNHFALYPHEENQAIFQRVLETGEPFFVEAKPFEFPDQPERGMTYWDWSLIPVKDSTGLVAGLVLTLAEVTQRKQAEKALRERERHLQSVFETMIEGVLLIAPDGEIIEANSAAERILGLLRSKIKGRSHVSPQWEALRPDGTPMQAEETAGFRAIKEKRPVKDVVGSVKRPNGEVSWINVNAAPLMNELGNLESVVATFTDITERRKAEEQIKSSLKEKEVLLQEIHHRVKNNMQVVASLLNLQKNRIKDEEYRAAFEESRNRVHSIGLVHELLYRTESLSNIELDGYIEKLANSLIQTQRSMVKITFTRDVRDVSLGIDQAVPCGLVLNELITNALTHAFSGRGSGKIEIKARQLDEEIELILNDNGRGIPKDIDYRNTETLGLQLVLSIVEEQLKGTWEMSRERGTRHTIRFRAK